MSRSTVKVLLTAACVAVVAPFAVAGASELPAVVTIRVWTAAGVPERATGTVVGPGEVLTVAHVLEGGARIEAGGRRAAVARRDAAADLALLRVPGVSGPRVRFGAAEGELRVLVVDGARAAVLRRRVVARLVDQVGRPRRRSLDLAVRVSSGDSGAAVVDARGRVVGVVYARSTRREGTAYAVATVSGGGGRGLAW